ncbi:MAG: TonB-dependent receptor, partial [Sphingomonas sp.]
GVPTNGSADGSRPPLDVTGIYSNLPLAGLSKYNFNVAAFYDKGGIYTRFAYSWRSKFLLTNRDCCFPFLPVYALSTGQLDGSVFLTVNKNFKIGIEAQNLLDTTTKTVFLLNPQGLTAPRSYFKSDRQFSITTRLTF